MNDPRLYQIALGFIPQVGAVTAKSLVSYCGSPEAVFQARRGELLRIPGIGPAIADAVLQSKALEAAEHELALLERHGIEVIFYTDSRYPVRLRQNPDCPVLLYFRGSDPSMLNARRLVAIVGTRQPTEYGKACCEELVDGLHRYGAVLVSGLAYGIDITAHRRATGINMSNIGVLGHGLGNIYPGQHRSTALKMLENGGLISEYPFHTHPDREHFPMRNRIIAGMCDAVVVVETAVSGGSMITAELAHQYGRDLFAVPGRIRDPKSAGCNLLIKTERARLAEHAGDLAESLRWDTPGQPAGIQIPLFQELSPDEEAVCTCIRAHPEIAIDALTLASGYAPGRLAAILLELEFKGAIRSLPGKKYLLNG